MARKRGAPVLIELISPQVTTAPQDEAPVTSGGRPNLRLQPAEEVEAKPEQVVPTTRAVPMPPRLGAAEGLANNPLVRSLAKVPPVAYLAGSAVVVICAIIWLLAFQTGKTEQAKQDEQRRTRELTPSGPPIGLGGSGPSGQPQANNSGNNAGNGGGTPIGPDGLSGGERATNPNGPSGGTSPGGGGGGLAPAPTEPAMQFAADPSLIQGLNYLVCGIFKRSEDADKAAAFLKSRGLPAVIISPRDLNATASSKDHMVIIMKGFAKDKYASSGLREKVQGLGRLWRAEDKRAPTDFAQPYWDKYK